MNNEKAIWWAKQKAAEVKEVKEYIIERLKEKRE